jgi:hypothetical protein
MSTNSVSYRIFKLISASILLILFVSIVFTALYLVPTASSSSASCHNTELRQAEVGYEVIGETNVEFGWNKTLYGVTGGVAVDQENFVYTASGDLLGTMIYKYNREGTIIWNRLWNYKDGSGDMPYLIAVDNQNNVIVTGITTYLSGDGDIFIVKYSPDGDYLWNVTWETGWMESLNDIAVDSGNNIWAVGTYQEGMGAPEDAFLIRYDPLGNLLLNKTWGQPSIYDYAQCCAVDESYRCYVGIPGFMIMVFNTLGTQLWNTSWGESSEVPLAIELDGANNFYVVGPTFALPSGAPGTDLFIVKFNSTGGVVWHRIWGTYDYPEQDADIVIGPSLIYVVGTHEGTPDYNVVVIAYDSEGNQPWHINIDFEGNEEARGIAVDATGTIYITGTLPSPYYGFLVQLMQPTSNGGDGDIPSFGLFFCILIMVAITSVIGGKKHSKALHHS